MNKLIASLTAAAFLMTVPAIAGTAPKNANKLHKTSIAQKTSTVHMQKTAAKKKASKKKPSKKGKK